MHRPGGERRRRDRAPRARRDVIVSNHRCHGHYLAFTDDVDGLLREVMGKQGGVCGGKGGSQHLCNDGFYSNGILGSTVPLAAGMALAERERGGDAVVTVFLGDGTLGQGVVYESLNIASLWGCRSWSWSRTTTMRSRRRAACRSPATSRPRGRVRHRDGRARDDRRRGDRAGRARSSPEVRDDAAAVLPRARHLPLQPALEGRRQPRPGRDRGGAHARPAPGRRRAARRRRARARSRRPSRHGSSRRSRTPTPPRPPEPWKSAAPPPSTRA